MSKMNDSTTNSSIKKEAPKRTRAFSTRAKTGCKTCKVRHVKCDEGRPGCRKCAQTGRKCDGYAHCTPSTASKSSANSSTPSPRSFKDVRYQLVQSVPDFLSPSLFTSEQERYSFHFFHTITAPQLEGCFRSGFWSRSVLQASHREASVRYAAIALGAMHERFGLEDGFIASVEEDTEENSFALRQYVKAINCLVQPSMCVAGRHTRRSANVALMTCVLFICFETLRGHHDAALAHIDGGIRILSEMQTTQDGTTGPSNIPADSSSIESIPVSTFRMIFSRVDIQASVLTSRARIIDGHESSPHPSPIPDTFNSLEEARESLESVWTCSARNLLSCSMYNGVPLPLTTNSETATLVSTRLEFWNTSFELYLRTTYGKRGLEKAKAIDKMAINVLRIQSLVTEVLFSASRATQQPDETSWDVFRFEYDAITNWAAEILYATSETQGERTPSTFTLDNGIIQPLFFVATKCRYRRTRSRAIALLKNANRQEGLWSSALTARVAERVRDIEEYGLAEEQELVPDTNRVQSLNMRFEFEGPEGRRAWLGYSHRRNSLMYEMGEWISIYNTEASPLDMRRSMSAPSMYGDDRSWYGGSERAQSCESNQEFAANNEEF
ncbi:putative UPC2 Regulatory involved in control of sterol uptake protein [Rutstroemia sp. NJR-2017a BVV2]|nr:putative UPC2 Regulatory involved in control of sterol uptake protein [Rutstroemia sp. NJR-2017a BVV2]